MARLTSRQQMLLQRNESLYARFGAPLEPHHNGEFIAISDKGEVMHGPDRLLVLEQATKCFGPDGFVFRRIGSAALGKWRTLVAH